MGVFVALAGGRPGRFCILTGLAFAIIGSVAHADEIVPIHPAGGVLAVHLDQARILKLPERTATLVVGNPLIADATAQPGGTLVITGKSYGATNLIALDRAGTKLMEHSIQVLGPRDDIVVVYRGVQRESYSCTPTCERRITLGDTADYFTLNLVQSGTLNSQAQSGGHQK